MARFRVRDIDKLRQHMKTHRREVVVDAPYSVRTLAQQVGANRSTIGFLVSGKRPVVDESVAKGVAEALEVPIDELFVPEASQSREEDGDASGRPL